MVWFRRKYVCTYHLLSLPDRGILQPWHKIYFARIPREEGGDGINNNSSSDGSGGDAMATIRCDYCIRDAEHEVYYYTNP
jgi:hypothetical protein